MVAGTLAKAGYFMGDRLYKPRDANPKGFFEDPEINGINENLLAQVLPKRPDLLGRWYGSDRPRFGQRWLARVPVGTTVPCFPDAAERIRKVTQRKPYCLKDPRFSYTLPCWRPFLKDTVFICVFRDPASTGLSILKECSTAEYLRDLSVTYDQVFETWTLMYRHILEVHCSEGDWLFLHFDQVLINEGLDRLKEFADVSIDRSFPETALRRSLGHTAIPEETWCVYEKLCRLAKYEHSGRERAAY